MLKRESPLFTLISNKVVKTIESSTNASPIEITDTGHGLETGDFVAINSHATNTAANGIWQITKTGANTFELTKNIVTGLISTGNGVGGATGTYVKVESHGIEISDWMHITVSIDTGTSADEVVKFVGSYQNDCPDFNATRSATNSYEYMRSINLQSGAAVTGDTGVTTSGADNQQFEINTNGMKWFGVVFTTGTAGAITITVRGFTNR